MSDVRLGPTQLDQTIADLCPDALTWPLGARVEIKPVKRAQTDSQRGFYWSALHEFGEHLGYSKGETEKWLHNEILNQAYGTKELKQFGGSMIAIPNLRSSKAKRDEYSELIRVLIQFAADNGYHIREP